MLKNAHAPSHKEIIERCKIIFKEEGEDNVLKYLAEVASHDYQSPDTCDEWAMNFYNENEDEIESED